MIAALVVHQYRARHPLMPVRQLATTFPATGILIAMCASASAVALIDLVLTALRNDSPVHAALLFLPEFGAAVVTAALFGALFRTRFTPVLAMSGLGMLTAAAALLTALAAGASGLVAAASALIGLGVGASVSPALFLAGFSLRSAQIQRVFALIELLRGVTAFLVAPILVYLATAMSSSMLAGLRGYLELPGHRRSRRWPRWPCTPWVAAGCPPRTWRPGPAASQPGSRRRCWPGCAARPRHGRGPGPQPATATLTADPPAGSRVAAEPVTCWLGIRG